MNSEEFAQLEDKLEGWERDAMRYRYLRNRVPAEVMGQVKSAAGCWIDGEDEEGVLMLLTGDDADAAVDAAMLADLAGVQRAASMARQRQGRDHDAGGMEGCTELRVQGRAGAPCDGPGWRRRDAGPADKQDGPARVQRFSGVLVGHCGGSRGGGVCGCVTPG